MASDSHERRARHRVERAVHPDGFEEAIDEAVCRATKTLRGVEGCWVKEMNVLIEDGNIVGYKVNVAITVVLEDGS